MIHAWNNSTRIEYVQLFMNHRKCHNAKNEIFETLSCIVSCVISEIFYVFTYSKGVRTATIDRNKS